MHPRQLRQLVPAVLTALGLEAVMWYLGHRSSLWRELLFPVHFLIAGLVLFTLWGALRQRGTGPDRRRRDRRRQARGGA